MIDNKLLTSKDLHTLKKDGVYNKDRLKLHKEIISKILAPHPKPVMNPESVLLGGGSATGKSSISSMLIEAYNSEDEPVVYINSDDIKEMLPEYIEMQESSFEEVKNDAARFVHDESSDIAEEILYECIDKRKNCIYDGTMKTAEKYKRIIADLKSASFTVKAVIVDVPLDVAFQRSQDRAELEGRVVPEEAIIESHAKVAATFYSLKAEFDSYIMYENSEKSPVIFALKRSREDEEIVFDPEKWRQFYSKSGITIELDEEIIFEN